MNDFAHEHRVETYKSMITISIEYYKALLLLNGAAAAGIVASIDKLVKVMSVSSIRWALAWFVVGLVCNAFALYTAWFTQNTLHNENIGSAEVGSHRTFVVMAAVLSLCSLTAFCLGGVVAVFGIEDWETIGTIS